MELKKNNDDVSEMTSPDVGLTWRKPMCSSCKYSNGRNCLFYNKERMNTGVNLFDCPSYEESDKSQENKAMKLMGVK